MKTRHPLLKASADRFGVTQITRVSMRRLHYGAAARPLPVAFGPASAFALRPAAFGSAVLPADATLDSLVLRRHASKTCTPQKVA